MDRPWEILPLTAARLSQSVAVIAHPNNCHTQTRVPSCPPPTSPNLIFRLLFLRVQDIMQHDRGFFWEPRHRMYLTVIATVHWPRPGQGLLCAGELGEEGGVVIESDACFCFELSQMACLSDSFSV